MATKIGKYIGYAYKTSFGNTLIAKEYFTNNYKGKYIVECDVCSTDSELFPFGSIVTSGSSLIKNRCVCGCNPKYKHSEQQYVIKILRRCEELGYDYLGFKGSYTGYDTKVILHNKNTGNTWDTASIQTFLLVGVKDPQEHFNNLPTIFSKPDEYHIQKFIRSGSFNNVKDWIHLNKNKWNYTCNICSFDEYVVNGLCSGVFSATAGHLKSGKLSCRCSPTFRWSTEQREYQLSKVMKEKGWAFSYWIDGEYKNGNSSFKWFCDFGHENTTTFNNFIKRESCKHCSSNGFNPSNPALIYIVRWEDLKSGFTCLKYGITNKTVKSRVTNQKAKSTMKPSVLYTFHSECGCDIESCEKEIKSKVGNNFCDKLLLPRGFSETVEDTNENLNKILGIIKTFNLTQLTP